MMSWARTATAPVPAALTSRDEQRDEQRSAARRVTTEIVGIPEDSTPKKAPKKGHQGIFLGHLYNNDLHLLLHLFRIVVTCGDPRRTKDVPILPLSDGVKYPRSVQAVVRRQKVEQISGRSEAKKKP